MRKKEGKISFKTNTKTLPEFSVTGKCELMKFLIENNPDKNRNNIKTLLKDRQILVDGKVVTQFNTLLLPGQTIKIRQEKEFSGEKPLRGITIIFEDKDLVVIDKHAGILSVSTEKKEENTAFRILSSYVKKNDPSNKIFIVHRLDRETSGLMVFAKNEKVKEIMQESWHSMVTERTYLAVTEGSMEKDEDTFTSYLKESKAFKVYSTRDIADGQKAVTHYNVIQRNKEYSLLRVNPETGRKNQIRVHLQDAGHPIIGDRKYGSKLNPIGRMALHAWVLEFKHPFSKEILRFETNIPRKFLRLFKIQNLSESP